MNDAPDPADPAQPPQLPETGTASVAAAAERARAELRAEIERVRRGVEEMLGERGESLDPDLRRELDALREESRRYLKKRVRKAERRVERSLGRVEGRTDQLEHRVAELEGRLARVEADRIAAEVRIHAETERLLDSLLRETRAVADLLTNPHPHHPH